MCGWRKREHDGLLVVDECDSTFEYKCTNSWRKTVRSGQECEMVWGKETHETEYKGQRTIL